MSNLTMEEVSKFREDNNNIIVTHAFSDSHNKESPIPNPVQVIFFCLLINVKQQS